MDWVDKPDKEGFWILQVFLPVLIMNIWRIGNND